MNTIKYNGKTMVVDKSTTSQDLLLFLDNQVSLVVQYYRATGKELFGFK